MKIIFILFILNLDLYSLSCKSSKKIIDSALKIHVVYNKLDNEISKRALEKFIKFLDPYKNYFLKHEIDSFKKKYNNKLDDMINLGNCKAFESIYNVYSKRFIDVYKHIVKFIDQKHDFSKEEYFVFENEEYANNFDQILDRWRLNIKYLLFSSNFYSENKKKVKKLKDKIKLNFKRQYKKHQNESIDRLYVLISNSFLHSLDPHTSYVPEKEAKEFNIRMKNSLTGIGAELQMKNDIPVIVKLIPGGAAARSGKLFINDKIIGVGQSKDNIIKISHMAMSLTEIVNMIRGPVNTKVYLQILRNDKTVIVSIVREKIQINKNKAKLYTYNLNNMKDKYKIGVLYLPSGFYFENSKDVKKHLFEANELDGLILNFINNPGGSLPTAIETAGFFLEHAVIVQTKSAKMTKPKKYYDNDNNQVLFSAPVIVLVNHATASAGEIVAGALKDHKRAIILGNTTYGKGSVQQIRNFGIFDNIKGFVKVTSQKFYTPGGSSTQNKGVEPDIKLDIFAGYQKLGERHLDYALKWSFVPSIIGSYPLYIKKNVLSKINYKNIKKINMKNINYVKKDMISLINNYFKKFKNISKNMKPRQYVDDQIVNQLKTLTENRVKNDKELKEIYSNIADYKNNESKNKTSLKFKKTKEKDKGYYFYTPNSMAENSEEFIKNDPFLRQALFTMFNYIQILNLQKPSKNNINIKELEKPKKV